MNIDEQADPSLSYVAPACTFRGCEIKPYSLGNKLLLSMILNDGDPSGFFLFALLFVLTQPRELVQRLCLSKEKSRVAILDWLDELKLNADEEEEGRALAESILEEASKEKVNPAAATNLGNE